jgi:hypothetical protein
MHEVIPKVFLPSFIRKLPMEIKITLLLCIIFGTLIFNSCKKYPDGPLLSLRSKQHRMVDKWEVTSYSCNGDTLRNLIVEDTSGYMNSCSMFFYYTYKLRVKPAKFYLSNVGDFNMDESTVITDLDYNATQSNCAVKMITYVIIRSYSNGTWKFADDKKQVKIVYSRGWVADSATYDILELKEKKMKWKGTNSGNSEEITFAKIK